MGFPRLTIQLNECVKSGCRPPRDKKKNHKTPKQITLHVWPTYTLEYRGSVCAAICEKKKEKGAQQHKHTLIHSLYHPLHLCSSRLLYMKGASGPRKQAGEDERVRLDLDALCLTLSIFEKKKKKTAIEMQPECTPIQPIAPGSSVTSSLCHGSPPCSQERRSEE